MMLLNVNVRLLLLMLAVLLGCLHCGRAVPKPQEAQLPETKLSDASVQTSAVTDTPSEKPSQPTLVLQAGHESGDRDEDGSPEGAQHTADAIVEPLTKLAHVTYDSVPVTHKPNDHMPLFHREGHDELNQS